MSNGTLCYDTMTMLPRTYRSVMLHK